MLISKNNYKDKMGLNIGLNALTSGSLVLITILLVITGILFVSAATKTQNLPEYNQSSALQNAYNKLRTAYILIFIAAGVALILAIAYGGHEIWWGSTEWVHLAFFLLLVALIIIAAVYAYTILNDVYTPELPERNGVDNFLWAGLWILLIAFIMIIAAGSGRVGYHAVRSNVINKFNEYKDKIDTVHYHVTGGATIQYDTDVPPAEMAETYDPGYAPVYESHPMVGPPPMPRCPGPVVVHAAAGPVPPSRTVTQIAPPVRTTHTTVTQSRPVVETTQRTLTRTEQPNYY